MVMIFLLIDSNDFEVILYYFVIVNSINYRIVFVWEDLD